MRTCIICKDTQTRSSGTLFCFPKNENLRGKWIEVLVKLEIVSLPWQPSSDDCICYKHFHESDFTNYMQHQMQLSSRLNLSPSACPTVAATPSDVPSKKRKLSQLSQETQCDFFALDALKRKSKGTQTINSVNDTGEYLRIDTLDL